MIWTSKILNLSLRIGSHLNNCAKCTRVSFKNTQWYVFYIVDLVTELGSLSGIFDCGYRILYRPQWRNFAIFLQLWFYVKSILAVFRRSKIVILPILETLNFGFWEFYTCQMSKTPKNSRLTYILQYAFKFSTLQKGWHDITYFPKCESSSFILQAAAVIAK